MVGIRPPACHWEWCEIFGCRDAKVEHPAWGALSGSRGQAYREVEWAAAERRSLRQSGDVSCHFLACLIARGKVVSVKGGRNAMCVREDGLVRGWRVNRTISNLPGKPSPEVHGEI